MKQHITIDQLNELTQKGRKALRKYILKEWAGPIKDARTKGPFAGAIYHAEVPIDDYLLSIGQMIEFLEENKPGWFGDVWFENLQDEPSKYYKGELADALWQAAKEILEK